MPQTEITPYDVKLLDLMSNPASHEHESLEELRRCCMINGAIDLSLIDKHGQYVDMGTNGGVKCDVRRGPCAYGATH